MDYEIRIKSPTYALSSDLVIRLAASATIFQLKTRIRESLANDSLIESSQKLIYAGHVLADDKTMTDLNIPSSATFHLVTSPSLQTSSPETQYIRHQLVSSLSVPANESSMFSSSNEVEAPIVQSPQSDQIMGPADHEQRPRAQLPINARAAEATATESSSTVPSTESDRVDAPPTQDHSTANIPNLLRNRQGVERTNISYDLHYIDGFPYLIKAADRPPRVSRRVRTPVQNHQTPLATQAASTNGPGQITSEITQSIVGGLPTRHVDLPATAAIPVRTADGRRALMLSPEGVRAMAAQGVNVDVSRRVSPFGIFSTSFRLLMTAMMPHAWLALKLGFLVAMLGSNSSWYRLTVLNLVAFGIFCWQSGLLANIIARGRPANPTAAAVNRDAPISPQGNQDPQPENPRSDPPQAQQTPFLHNLGRAFLSSILPSAPSLPAPVAPVPPRPNDVGPAAVTPTTQVSTVSSASTEQSAGLGADSNVAVNPPGEENEGEHTTSDGVTPPSDSQNSNDVPVHSTATGPSDETSSQLPRDW